MLVFSLAHLKHFETMCGKANDLLNFVAEPRSKQITINYSYQSPGFASHAWPYPRNFPALQIATNSEQKPM
jgi:hypothetical protein